MLGGVDGYFETDDTRNYFAIDGGSCEPVPVEDPIDNGENGQIGDYLPVAFVASRSNAIRLALNILPRNPIATGGKSLQEYQNDLVDTLFERMPLRRFDVSSLPSGGDEIVFSVGSSMNPLPPAVSPFIEWM